MRSNLNRKSQTCPLIFKRTSEFQIKTEAHEILTKINFIINTPSNFNACMQKTVLKPGVGHDVWSFVVTIEIVFKKKSFIPRMD